MPPKTDSNTYDVLIVGAGIAGFYVATQLAKRHRRLRIALADKYKFLGGRTFTHSYDISGVKYQWEAGAARISEHHTLTLGLLKRYRLGQIPITGQTAFRGSGAEPLQPSTNFEPAIPILLEPLYHLAPDILSNSTIRELLVKIHGPKRTAGILDHYPYRAELEVMRADMALQLFKHEFGGGESYTLVREGFSELIRRMETEFKEAGGTILPHHELQTFTNSGGVVSAEFRVGRPSDGQAREEVAIVARHLVLAIPSLATKEIPPLRGHPSLAHLQMEPLLRIYAVFPKGPEGKVWFEGLPRIVTAARPRYIIPADPAKGVIQISYTDSRDAEPLIAMLDSAPKGKGDAKVGALIVEDLRTLLGPNYKIPDPLFVKAHPWNDGATYWLPGDYDPYRESRQLIRPLAGAHPNVYLCGESYSTRQCWVEGALEHASDCLAVLEKRL